MTQAKDVKLQLRARPGVFVATSLGGLVVIFSATVFLGADLLDHRSALSSIIGIAIGLAVLLLSWSVPLSLRIEATEAEIGIHKFLQKAVMVRWSEIQRLEFRRFASHRLASAPVPEVTLWFRAGGKLVVGLRSFRPEEVEVLLALANEKILSASPR